MRFIALLVLILASVSLAQTVSAQSMGYVRALDDLNQINRVRPEQSGRHVSAKKVFTKRLLDKTNRVVGEIEDVLLHRSGAINSLSINFDRLRLDTGNLYIDYDDMNIRPVSNGYKMALSDDEIKAAVPELLAATETAAGDNASQTSVRALIGKTLHKKKGGKVATIKDVLFDARGDHVDYLFVSLHARTVKGETLAIPFSKASYKGSKITIPNEYADAMIAHARSN